MSFVVGDEVSIPRIGDLSMLSTSAKNNIVYAINEIIGGIDQKIDTKINEVIDGLPDTGNASMLGNQLPAYYQPVTDNTLQTVSKTVPGAINELKSSLSSIDMSANAVGYDGTASGLAANNVQAAIDEMWDEVGDISLTATNITYANSGTGLAAANVQAAVTELKTLMGTQVTYGIAGSTLNITTK